MLAITFIMDNTWPMTTQITKFMRPTWGPPGSFGPRWAPCWPHESCYQGNSSFASPWPALWSCLLFIVELATPSLGIEWLLLRGYFYLWAANRTSVESQAFIDVCLLSIFAYLINCSWLHNVLMCLDKHCIMCHIIWVFQNQNDEEGSNVIYAIKYAAQYVIFLNFK